jgi:hypothetical protein
VTHLRQLMLDELMRAVERLTRGQLHFRTSLIPSRTKEVRP